METTTPTNPMTADDAAAAMVETGVMKMCKEFLVTAIQDRRLQRRHLVVLACFVRVMNLRTAKAWPSRATLAAMSGFAEKTISNTIIELREFDYLLSIKEPVEEANNRNLTVYAFGNIDHETLRRQITEFVEGVQAQRDKADGKETSRQAGNKSSRLAGNFPTGRELWNLEKSPPAGNNPAKNSQKFPTRREQYYLLL